jgi:hypothetical protein
LGEHLEFSLGPFRHGSHNDQEIEKQLFLDRVVDLVGDAGYQFLQRSVTGVNGACLCLRRPASDAAGLPLGRWAITDRESGDLIGGVALLPLPPGRTDLEIGWQVAPTLWGHGYGAEAGHAVAHQAFTNVGVDEVFAVVRPGNHRGVATARRVGMEWVGETDK